VAGDNPFSDIGAELFEHVLKNIYQERVDVKNEIEPNLFFSAFNLFDDAVKQAFGQVEWGQPNYEFVNELRHNNAVFSAFRAHAQANELAKQLLDENDKLKSFSKFKTDCAPVLEKWNVNHLKTEYNTAVIRARAAAKWKDFERDADLYPNLMWLPSTSAEQRPYHQPFYGKIWPINDPFWSTNYPGNLWNCKCGITNTDSKPTGKGVEADYKPADGLDGNPGKTAKLFSDKHPYIADADKGVRKLAEQKANEIVPLPETYKGKKGGYLNIVPQNGAEAAKNLKTYKIMADNGGQYELIKPINNEKGKKNPDALNRRTGKLSDAKHPVTDKGINAIQNSIKEASRQGVSEVVIRLDMNYSVRSIFEGFKAALQGNRASSIETIILIRKNKKPMYFKTEELRAFFKRKQG
jgi:hypothetical protein